MSNGIYEKYNIDKNKLKRDYLKNPLIRSRSKYKNESIHQDDFQYLFIELNLSANDLHNIFGWSKDTIYDWSYKFNIKKSKENIIKHTKQTNLEKYGVDNISKTQYFKNVYKQIMMKKYGVEHYSQTDEYKIKFKNTLKKNGKCRGSKEENIIYQKLLQIFPNVERWYSCDERYPFECDFYIPLLDTFIEYQGDWYHGKKPYNEPYDSTNENHNKMLNKWKLKNEEFMSKGINRNKYARAIKIWTIKDPYKRQIAFKNNLNYIEIFDINDVDNILEGLKNVKK